MLADLLSAICNGGREFRATKERRLHNRALAYWRSMRRHYDYPILEGFAFLDREELADHAFLLDLASTEAPRFEMVGSILCDEADLTRAPASFDDAPPESLLGRFAARWVEVAATGDPIVSEYEFETHAGYKVSCRGVLLPLSNLGSHLDWVLGVISWKSEISMTQSQKFAQP